MLLNDFIYYIYFIFLSFFFIYFFIHFFSRATDSGLSAVKSSSASRIYFLILFKQIALGQFFIFLVVRHGGLFHPFFIFLAVRRTSS